MTTEEKIHQHMSKTCNFLFTRTFLPGKGIIVRDYFDTGKGFELSIQASRAHSCSPSTILGPNEKYEEVEIYHGDTPLAHLKPDDEVMRISIKKLAEELDKL